MKIGIFYGTKTQTTETCAKELANLLPNSHLINLNFDYLDVDDFDFIVIGSNVRLGKINKNVKKFLKKNKSKLYNKKVAYFLCNVFQNKTLATFKRNLDPKLYNRAQIIKSFGGEIALEKQKGIDKFISKVILKLKTFEKTGIDYNAISEFAREIKEIGIR